MFLSEQTRHSPKKAAGPQYFDKEFCLQVLPVSSDTNYTWELNMEKYKKGIEYFP